MPLLLEAIDLACSRGGLLIFSGLSFRVLAGEMLTVTGPNGSGKSSLLRLLAGLLPPGGGSVRLDDGSEDQGAAHYVGHADALKPALTLRETLRFWSQLYRQGRVAVDADFSEASDRTGLRHALDLPVGVLSAGQRRRVVLARLILSPRPLWLLDEPTASLDRDGEAVLGALVRDHLAGGGIIVAATHQELPIASVKTIRLGGQT